jgi:hypothetical protein
MKFAGLLVMPAGFFLTLAALVMFGDPIQRFAFILCGIAVEALGLGVTVRAQMASSREQGR